MSVLITDGNAKSSLNATRSLGKKGIKVIVGDAEGENLAGASRYCYKCFKYADPFTEPDKFLKDIISAVERHDIQLIFPMTDIAIDIILSHAISFEHSLLRALPSYESYSLVTDKTALIKLASTIGVPIPESVVIENKKQLLAALKHITFPIVIKPIRSRLFSKGRYTGTAVQYANSKEMLLSLYETNEYLRHPFILQRLINGHGVGAFTLCDHGKPIAYFSHKRLREKPPSGGVSALSESMELSKDIRKFTKRLIVAAKWHGVAMAEFKVDSMTGIPYLMEINGRFWGSLRLSIESGVDFPYLLYRVATDRQVICKENYKVGTKLRWFLGDLDHLYFRLFKSVGNQGLDNSALGRIKSLFTFLKPNGSRCHFDVIDLTDIKPFIIELKHYLRPW